jgi:photosystem II stability/assembly factor-like uncharacterized protein
MRRKAALTALSLLMSSLFAVQARAEDALWVDSMPIPDQAITHMSAFSTGDAFVFMHNRNQSVYRSKDHGLTWEPLETPSGAISIFEMTTPTTGFVTGSAFSPPIYKTTDGAESWEKLPPLRLRGPMWKPGRDNFAGYDFGLEAIASRGPGDNIALGGYLDYLDEVDRRPDDTECYYGKSNAAVFFSDDGGDSGRYTITRLPFNGWVSRLGFLTPKIGWALAYEMVPDEDDPCYEESIRTVVLLTRDGGKTYRESLSCPHVGGQPTCTSVAMASPQKIFVGSVDGVLYLSRDGGYGYERHWQLVPPGVENLQTHWVSGIEFASPKVGYAVAKGGGTYRTSDAGESWVFEPSTQASWGIGIGDIAVGDKNHAIAGGPNSIIARVPR